MHYDSENIFARILRGEIPCNKVYEDEYALAFYDIAPHAPTHILVIPKGPYVSLFDFGKYASSEELNGFWRAVSVISEERNLVQDGFRAISNSGADAGQEVPHFHVHLLAGTPLGPILSKKM
ncbi:adenosine 5'-monophosphoramidase [Neokomagataea thailandica NBRC 106555]|uniref:Histidine triad nucleotide-binding protein n=2 Tax=Neokomagataea TaxID=1223423 RepID=A0A4Y6VA23_9PROT|nr:MULTISPECIES: histidine triad nucleotide-binding protein [Neokomagataea]QDH25540.1 histidine triad nucleotide-binding protein [Neokomagataea tanensis]GBR55621.1 adenosine 5'-monophosphoramidase [Neokomagataea thailandica NBRC 106555]